MVRSIRLYTKGVVLGFRRNKRNQDPNTALLKIEGVKCREDTQFYLGKRVVFIYRGKKEKHGTKIRTIWGRIARAHGSSGAVRARFQKNLPPRTFGATVRVMLYPSNI